jgi:hypothetical protein
VSKQEKPKILCPESGSRNNTYDREISISNFVPRSVSPSLPISPTSLSPLSQ